MFVNLIIFAFLFLVCDCLAPEKLLKKRRNREDGAPYSLISKKQTRCEVEALAVGSSLADNYNSFDENTEWDARIHSDYMTEYIGFFGMITAGVWGKAGRTAELRDASKLAAKGGWQGQSNITQSAYWALENQWVYMMGDSTQRQLWATFLSPSQGNNFERNSKEWTREHCRRQYPHRRMHPSGGSFPEESWMGKCGNNEVTCDLSGYGPQGLLTYDWKHFPWEDYDEWVFGDSGPWGNFRDTYVQEIGTQEAATDFAARRTSRRALEESGGDSQQRKEKTRGLPNSDVVIFDDHLETVPKTGDELRRPDILVIELGLHTCFHAWDNNAKSIHEPFVVKHEDDLPVLFEAIKNAIARPMPEGSGLERKDTTVIISTAGRIGTNDPHLDRCSWRFNRQVAMEAHKAGFAVFEREEIERRLLFKSDHHTSERQPKYIKPNMHLAAPGPQISTTSLLALMSCLRRNEHDHSSTTPYHRAELGPNRDRVVPVHSSTDDEVEENSYQRRD